MVNQDVAQGYLNAAMEALRRANHELGNNPLCIKLIHDLEDLMNKDAREDLAHVGSVTVLRNFATWLQKRCWPIDPKESKGAFDREETIDALILEFVREFGQ